MVRPTCVDSNGIIKGAWSEEEDEKLRSYIQRYGHWNWRLLPKYAGLSRCGKSCRLRWVNYLKPGVKRGNFSKQEEDLLLELHAQLGNKWSAISDKLPGRTDNEIKNFWHTRVQKRARGQCNPPAKKIIEIDTTLDETSLCKQNSDPDPTLSFDSSISPSEISIAERGPVDSWPDAFPAVKAYSQNDHYFPPLPLPEENTLYSGFHFNGLSCSGSSSNYLSGLDDDHHSIISSDYVADLWSESNFNLL